VVRAVRRRWFGVVVLLGCGVVCGMVDVREPNNVDWLLVGKWGELKLGAVVLLFLLPSSRCLVLHSEIHLAIRCFQRCSHANLRLDALRRV
jgi:hypothetical protein